ncbi:threonylcarbamoyl-AMP synthase [Solirubrobacter sp. CPCC 204708]|uniref:L-threonylcarbamoyladenylate synthase n=1 Tax=Solirubrobacter deserti TaxID=2282478 RepID=A0ABT4RKD2_9ACTN|nr:L-threonylcarbamoyladenylate synthase [Solirubrobacter deserti]MBE2316794.1 threonylcarbamoyl-AMP synthase [Solirubrobacter deserti]MDA0138991.1 L-threonylcarbamoyladenylate synthase [Solirubrobacter deserti]
MPLEVHDQLTRGRLLPLSAVAACVEHLRGGGLAVLPTETGYMLAVDATDEAAIDAVYAAKGRPEAKPIHVAVASLEEIDRVTELPEEARRLCLEHMPGPLTLVGRSRGVVPDALTAHTGTLGARIPDTPATLQILAAFRGPLTATSHNLSGEPPDPDPIQAAGRLHPVGSGAIHVVVDPEAIKYDRPSTVVDTLVHPWDILREGPVTILPLSG